MEFKNAGLIDRELEILGYLKNNFSLKEICDKTSLSRKHLVAHLRNLMQKCGAENISSLVEKFRLGADKP